jgi:iron(II)-dependent oxidoreductase
MVGHLDTTVQQGQGAEQALEDLASARTRTLELVAHVGDDALETTPSPIMSPLVWDLAHIAAYEDLWLVHRHGDEPLLHPELAAVYDAFETPRIVRGEIELLDAEQGFAYLRAVRERTERVARRDGVGDGLVHEMVLRHELQHTETMLQTMAIANLLPPTSVIDPAGERVCPGSAPGWISIEGGSCEIGADGEHFAYDNERPRHEVSLAAYEIAGRPVNNEEWRRFRDDGGYERREHWSPEGWAWRERADPVFHPAAGSGEPSSPVCHLCFHEAQALAHSRGARLPSEAEWEHAATSARPRLAGRGRVWEWTSSDLAGYPGFVAFPYREYSEVFFAKGHRVLRGGSWATSKRVATDTFRNWDLPVRRQIFAGVRLARDT